MAYIRKVKTASGSTAVQIARKQKGQIVKINHIGSAQTPEELTILVAIARKILHENQLELFPEKTTSDHMRLMQSYSGLLWNLLRDAYKKIGFDFFKKTTIFRCLSRVVDQEYRKIISQACYDHINGEMLSLVLYNVTTLYFEIQKEDNYRKSGLSKEWRLEPQIIIGLIVDQNGFPLGLHSFEGNVAETKTILPVIKAFQDQYGLQRITIVADAAMLSKTNMMALQESGYTFIVGSRLQKVPYEIAEYQRTGELIDQQIVNSHYEGYRVIYQYREKRAALDLKNIEKQIIKAKKAVNGQITTHRMKFLSVKAKSKELNQKLIEKAYALAGIKGYVTNLDIADQEVIACYHQLFQVEKTFRMAKSDLKARPIYHHKRDAIEAYLTIVLAALAISKHIEHQTGISINQFVKILRPIRSGLIVINENELLLEPVVPPSVKSLIDKLSSGH